jgi:hypothetical protein
LYIVLVCCTKLHAWLLEFWCAPAWPDQLADAAERCLIQRLSANACRFLTPPGRAWYIQHILRAYNELFGTGVMEAWVAQQGPEKLAAQIKVLVKTEA